MNAHNKSWIEINKTNLIANIALIKQFVVKKCKVAAMLKGNAYGHGLLEVAQCVVGHVDAFCVINVDDAIKLHQLLGNEQIANEKKIIVLGPVTTDEILDLSKRGIEIAISDYSWENHIEKIRMIKELPEIRVHIYIDTGLGREGISSNDLEKLFFLKESLDIISIVGIMTHFSNADVYGQLEYANQQMDNYEMAVDYIKTFCTNADCLLLHTSASSPSLLFDKAVGHYIRPGIGLYGHWTTPETKLSCQIKYQEKPELRSVLSWKCKIQIVKKLKKGMACGYDLAHICQKDTTIGIIPVGYYDGYPYQASGKAYVLVYGKRCAVLGNIMMNNIIIDLSDVVNDDEKEVVVTLIGQDKDDEITVEQVAQWSNSINYQVLTGLNALIPKIIIH